MKKAIVLILIIMAHGFMKIKKSLSKYYVMAHGVLLGALYYTNHCFFFPTDT